MNDEIDKWIDKRVEMVLSDFSEDQIAAECWKFCLSEYNDVLNLEAVIYKSMQMYAEVIKRVWVKKYSEQ